ncbi:hypothetical protein MTO96_037960, partial [Rhipicephalus appendiculatus]
VPMEAATSSPEATSAQEEGISAPDSAVVKQEQVAAAIATAPLSAQPDTGCGDSPLMFWAFAAPAHK